MACTVFVEHYGLKHLFAAFMGKLAKSLRHQYASKSEAARAARELEGRAVSILGHLVSCLLPDSPVLARVLAKFVENEFEKSDRLVEMLVEGWNRDDQIQVGKRTEIRNREREREGLKEVPLVVTTTTTMMMMMMMLVMA